MSIRIIRCKHNIHPPIVFIFTAHYHLLVLAIQLMLFMLRGKSGRRLQEPPNGGTELHKGAVAVIQFCLICKKRRK